ncbi:MAG: metal-dependent transcriptional regulator [Acidobacteria bacterium]|nr:metal-dependent transcriptional regulator [Acidobacteriota bacterium]
MFPTSTVENYLKSIYQAQSTFGADQLVPMGQLAANLGVVPGTATKMVKALAEAGLVVYEPYGGVRLTEGGEKLAAMVLRRHRIIELFLVRIMGMNWGEVHEEAEKLEHVVSETLIARMDEMLGSPKVDPHGDPIPDPEGMLQRGECQTLLDCPIGMPVTIVRVTDQDVAFLKFIEENRLMPGQTIQVESRDPVAESVHIRSRDARPITLGMGAAAKVLVQGKLTTDD